MPESMKSQVVNVLAEAEVSLEDLDSAGLYFVEVSDDRVKAHLSTLPNFDTCCQRLSNAAELGVLALEAARPLEVTTEIQERFHHLSEQFEARIKQAEETLRTTLEQQFQHELERVFKEGGTLEQRVRTLVASDGVLAQTLKEKGQELSSLFDPDNTESFVAHFKTLLSSYLSEDGEWQRSARIAMEVKNRECTRSGQEAYFLNELDSGMANRECEFGIVVACLEKNADEGKPHFPYLQVQTGNRFVVLSDEDATVPVALEAALHLVARAANAKAEAERAEIDTNRINDAVARALNVVERFRALKLNLTTSIASLEKIRQSVDGMETEVEAALKEAQAEVRKALQEGLEPIEQ